MKNYRRNKQQMHPAAICCRSGSHELERPLERVRTSRPKEREGRGGRVRGAYILLWMCN